MEKYLCWFTHGEPYVSYESVIKKMVGSTSRSSNIHGFIDNNNDHYRSMVMDAMRINQDYTGECLIIDEELNTYATMFFF